MINDVERSIYLDTKRMTICFFDGLVMETISQESAGDAFEVNGRLCHCVLVKDFDLLMKLFKESCLPGSFSFEESDFRGMINVCVEKKIIDNDKAKRVVEMFFNKRSNA